MTRSYGLGLVGTARRQRSWPPKVYKDVNDKRFYTVYLLPEPKNFLLLRWVDSDVVDMVSTVHEGNSYKAKEKTQREPAQQESSPECMGQ